MQLPCFREARNTLGTQVLCGKECGSDRLEASVSNRLQVAFS